MATLVTDPTLEERLKSEREESGANRIDEVWEGVYVMAPMPNDEHQQIVTRLSSVFQIAIGWPGLGEVRAGVNVSDRDVDWDHDYRVPDVAVFLRGGRAHNCGTHWSGGPDFIAEILSVNDGTRDKLPFYSRIGVRELLLVDRNPWRLELYRSMGNELREVGVSIPEQSSPLVSQVIPFRFSLLADPVRPLLELMHNDDQAQRWLV